MDCTQVLFSESFEEVNSTNEKIPVATLEIEGVFFTIYNSENYIGRDDTCDITIKNNTVSSRHAVIEAEDPTSHLIYDLGSTNKTKLGKITLKPHVRYHIKDGDLLTLGNVSALYKVSRKIPSTPEKVELVESVPETPERGEPSKDVISESSSEEDKRNLSGLDNSDLDLFDENECDTSVQQELVGSTAGHLDKDNDIYQMDTINFDSDDFNPANENRLKEINVAPSKKQPSSDENKSVIDIKNLKSDEICDSQNDKESLYDVYTQVCKKTNDEIEACDSTVKGMETDKEIMEVTSSVADIRSNDDANDNDISVYDVNTQCDNEVNKEKQKSNNFEWEDFPEIASPLGVDTSNADNLDCTGSAKFQEKPATIEASGAIDLDITESAEEKPDRDIKGVNPLEKLPYDLHEPVAEDVNGECSKERSKDSGSDDEKKNCDDIKNNLQSNEEYFNGDLEEGLNDSFLPASQNVDMFDTSINSKNSLEKKKSIVSHFNESDDDSMYNIATQIFPQNDSRDNKNDQSAINDEGASFIFEPATQPTDADQAMKARASVSRVDETLTSSFFEAPTQPMEINREEALRNSASINTDAIEELKSPNKYLEADISSSIPLKEDSQLLLENKQTCSKNNAQTSEKDIAKDFAPESKPLTIFELATEPFIEPQGKSTTPNTTSAADDVIKEDKSLDDTCSDPVNDSLSIFNAATQPFIEQQAKTTNLNSTRSADYVIEEDKSLDVIDSPPINKSLGIFEAVTQPVIEDQDKSTTRNITSAADNAIKDDKLFDVTSSDPINEPLGIFEAATQPVIEHRDKSTTRDTTSAADNSIKDVKLFDVTGSDLINESLGIFEAATQPIIEHQGKSTTHNITSAADKAIIKDKSPEVTDKTIYNKYILKDSDILKNEQHTIENKKLPVNESFYEAATQPVPNDIIKDKPVKDPFEDEVMESIVDMDAVFRLQDDSKQFSEELPMSESFYEAETQPIVIDPSNETSASSKNICMAHENKEEISDKDKPSSIINISSNLSISKNVLATDKEHVSEKKCDSIPSAKDNLVDNDLNSIDMNEKGENKHDESSKNVFTKSFYELATQPASKGEDFHNNQTTTSTSLKTKDHDASTIKSNQDILLTKENEDKNESRKAESGCSLGSNIVTIKDMKSDLHLADTNTSDPSLDVLDQDFYNVATQPVSQDNVAVKLSQIDTCTKMSTALQQAELTDCRSILMELSESIFTSNVQSGEKNLEKTAKPLLAQKAMAEENNSSSEEKIPIKKYEDANESTSNKTVQDSVDMSFSCIDFNETRTKNYPKSNAQGVSVPTLKEKVIDSKDHSSVEKDIEDPNLNSTQSLLKILMGEDEILPESISQKINNCNKSIEITKNVQESDRTSNVEKLEQTIASSGNDVLDDKNKEISTETQKDIGISDVSEARIKRRSRSVRNKAMPSTSRRNCRRINSDDDSQGFPSVTEPRKKSRVLSISEESELSSEEFVIKCRKKRCNVFPSDTQDMFSSGKENVLLTNIETTEAKTSTAECKEELQKKEENKKTNNDESNVIEEFKSVSSGSPPKEPTHSNKENTSTIESTDDSLKGDIANSHSPVLKENSSRDNSFKKHKSPSERDQTYISRGNITLHSQEVLEELEEQFRLAADSMSPTQLSVASESENEYQGEAQDSPVARRSERKLKSKTLYKPLVNKNEEQKNCDEEIVNKTHKKSIKTNDLVDSEVVKNDSSTSEEKKQPAQSNENIITKSVKKFKKATPIKEKLSISNVDSLNKSFNSSNDPALDVSKMESPDCSDSQSSFSNNENSESEGLGRGKRKRTKTSFDDFVVDDNFKKQRKKTSLPYSQSLKSDSQNIQGPQEKPVLTQALSIVLHDINKSSKPSSESPPAPSSLGIRKNNNNASPENDEDDLIIAPKTKSLGKTKNLKKKSEDTKMENKVVSECSSKDTTSFCEKLDELFNIWGPADRVKLSPRVPKKTRKVLENEQNTPSKKKSGTSSPIKNSSNKVNSKDNVTSENEKRNSRNNTNNRNKQANMSTSLPTSSTNSGDLSSSKSNNSGRRLPTKHKMNEEDTNELEGKKPKRNRKSSEAETPSASPVKTMRLTRHNSASLLGTDVKTLTRKRPATKNPKKEGQTSSPAVKSKTKSSAELKNNSQDGINRKSRPASPNLENMASNNPSCSMATLSKKKSKKSNQELPSKINNNKNHKNDNCISSSSEYDMDNFYPMSQEFSFHVKNEDIKSPMKEEFKPPLLKVRRSARSKNSEKNSQKRNPEKVMFTGISDRMYSALVTKLGGEVVDSPFTCTVLISDKVRRTAKFLSALSRGIPIVTPEWLIKSSNSFADVEKFIIADKEAEKTYAFNLKESLQKARNTRLFDGWSVYITPSVKPPQEEIKSLIECSGGKCLMKAPSRWPPNSLIISCEEDKEQWKSLLKRGKRPPIVGIEALFSGILQQNLDTEQHRLI